MLSVIKLFIVPLPYRWQVALRRNYRVARDVLGVWRAGIHDARWYSRYSGVCESDAREVLGARILKSYHRIEKGLALTSPRPGFGYDAIKSLIVDLRIYQENFGRNHLVSRGVQVLAEYQAFNLLAGVPLPHVNAFLQACAQLPSARLVIEGGTMEVTREAILSAGCKDMLPFFQSRYSVRQFSTDVVNPESIEQAVRMAQKTPSVCNRQASKVFVVDDKSRISALLAFQNGNRGFGEQADKLLVVTSDLSCFLTAGERNQCWVDGGLFAMSLIYALHSLGLGTCCLNWSVEPATDTTFKAASGIPENHAIILLLAVGQLPAKFRVAISARRPLDEVLAYV